MKEMFRNGTYFKLNTRTRNTLFRKFKLLYSRITKIQLSTGIKTAGIAMAFSLISSMAVGQSAKIWIENPEGTAVFNSGFWHGDRAVVKFVDIDGDGDEDMFFGGKSGNFRYKFYRNQGVNAAEQFVFDDNTNDAQGVLPLSLNIGNTPPHIAFIDNDNDNDLDIYATNPSNGTILYYKNISSGNNIQFQLTTGTENKFNNIISIHSIAFADIDGDSDTDALLMTSNNTVRYFDYTSGSFTEQTGTNNPFNGLTLENPSMDFRDLDGDNDIDAIAHDCNDLVFLENTTTSGQQQFVINTTDTIIQGTNSHHLYPVFVDLDEDNDKDLFISDYSTGEINNFYQYEYNSTDSVFTAIASGITTPIKALAHDNPDFYDLDNDGDLDLYIDNTYRPSPNRLYINVGTSTNPEFQQAALAAFNIPQILSRPEEFVDIDDDGDLDFFHFDNYAAAKMYKNIGSASEAIFELQDASNNPISHIISFNYPSNFDFTDIDNDGDFDLATSIYASTSPITIYENTGDSDSASFSTLTLNPNPFASLSNSYTPYTLQFFDFDGDSKDDIIFQQYNSSIYIFRNTTTNSINFELITEAPLGNFNSPDGILSLVNLFGESSVSIIIDEVGGEDERDTIRYYNYVDLLSIEPNIYSIDERSDQGSFVGRINYTYHGDSTLTFSITAGNTGNAFAISGDSILVQTPSAIDYDIVANRTFNLRVQSSDGDNSVDTIYTVNLNNILLFFDDQTLTQEEIVPTGTIVGQITSEYEGDGTLTYSITGGNNDNAFAISGNNIIVQNANALDYDIVANRVFNLTIEASDGVLSKTANYTINLEEVIIRIHDRAYLIRAESDVGTIVGSIASEYYGNDNLILSITSGNTNDAFEIVNNNIVVRTKNAVDYTIESNRTFNLTIEARDNSVTKTATYTINISFRYLSLEPRTYTIDERSSSRSLVGLIEYNYYANNTLTFNIASGNNDNAFELDYDSIEVQTPAAINYDIVANRTFNLIIGATDGTYSADTTYTININNVFLFFNNRTFTQEERVPTGTVVGQITSDYDGTETVTYSITGGNTDNAFAISGDNIVVQNANALNYDIVANRTFNLTIEATDGNVTKTATYTINLEEVILRIHDGTYLIHAESAVGTVVGLVNSEHYGDGTLELSITAGNTGDAFEIVDSNIVVKTANALDYTVEANRRFNLIIEAREGNVSEIANYTINVTLNFLNIEDSTYTIDEGSAAGTVVGQIVSSYFGTETVTYSITDGNTNNAFRLDGTNIVVQNPEALNYDIEANRTFNLTIEATDGTETATAVYTININDVVTAINITDKNDLAIYPNPTLHKLNVEIGDNLGDKVLIKLIANSGIIVYKQIVFANTSIQINTSKFKPGVYFVKIITDDKTISEKVIIK